MEQPANSLVRFIAAPFRTQTYLNLIYLLLAFPLGIAYFVYLVVGFSVSLALAIVLVGLLLVPLVFFGCWLLAAFERAQAIWLLREDVPPMQTRDTAAMTGWDKVKAHLVNPVTWKSLVFLFAKFPLGIVSFVAAVSLGALTLALLAAPLTFSFFPIEVWFTNNSFWLVDTLPEALLLFAIGLPVGLVSLNLLNGLAWVSGKFARFMLGATRPAVPAVPVAYTTPVTQAVPYAAPAPAVVEPAAPAEAITAPAAAAIPPEPVAAYIEPEMPAAPEDDVTRDNHTSAAPA